MYQQEQWNMSKHIQETIFKDIDKKFWDKIKKEKEIYFKNRNKVK